MNKLFFIIVLIWISLFNGKSNNINNTRVQVIIDSRVELLGVLCYLADYIEYSQSSVKSYKIAVDNYFLKYKNHEAVAYFKELRKKHNFGYDAPMAFAIYLTDSITPIIPFNQLHFGYGLSDDSCNLLAGLVKKFSIDTKFNDFNLKIIKKYDSEVTLIDKQVNSSVNFDWFQSFFGELPKNINIKIVVCLISGNNNYGPSTFINNEKIMYSINGALDTKRGISLGTFSNAVLIHEICHSFCNPIIYAHKDTLAMIGKRIFTDFKSHPHNEVYGDWVNVLDESFVRASVICYLKENESWIKQKLCLIEDKSQGFLWIKPLSNSFMRLSKKMTVNNYREQYIGEIIKDLDKYLARK
jgi:hypothetical protein